jgi:protein phosphatase 1D
MDNIVSNPYFWSENDEDVLKAIKEGFLTTHQAMFKVLGELYYLQYLT